MRIAVLIACHNRVRTTTTCLQRLFAAGVPDGLRFEVFLVDDASTDGTADEVRRRFPQVTVLPGSGRLFWSRGVRLAWQQARSRGGFDGYLWLNDDVAVYPDALIGFEAFWRDRPDALIAGACRDARTGSATYGFQGPGGPVQPTTQPFRLTRRHVLNGNFVWVPDGACRRLGILRRIYRHSRSDADYGWRALRAGYDVLLTPFYVGTCSRNGAPAAWQAPGLGVGARWRAFNAPKGVPFLEYVAFQCARRPVLGWLAALKWPWTFVRACRAPAAAGAPGKDEAS